MALKQAFFYGPSHRVKVAEYRSYYDIPAKYILSPSFLIIKKASGMYCVYKKV